MIALVTGGEMRTKTIPGIPGHTIWAIRDAAGVASLRAAIEPGQVWVRVDNLDSRGWEVARSIARMAVVRDLGKVPSVGRRKGSRNRDRLQLLEAIRADPSLSDDEIDRLGVERKMWRDAPGDYDEGVAE